MQRTIFLDQAGTWNVKVGDLSIFKKQLSTF